VTSYTPQFSIKIKGVEYSQDTIDQVTITVGRNDIFDTVLPGYCLLELVNLSGTSPALEVLDEIVISTTDSNGDEVALFTGEITSVSNSIVAAGSNNVVNSLTVTGVGSMARLVRRNAGGNPYPQELDGERIRRILEDALFVQWEDLPSSLIWDNIDAAQTWSDFGIQGVDEIDDGRFVVEARNAEFERAADIARITESTGLGYLYETPDGRIGYADAERRTKNIANNSIALDADYLNARLITRLNTQDVVNSVVIQYDDQQFEVQAINDESVEKYGLIEDIVNTLLVTNEDAEEQAFRYVALRGNPSLNLDSITLNLVNGNIDNDTRDVLLGVSMDTLLVVTGLPEGITADGFFEGFVEGWTWTLSKGSLELEMKVSNALFSAFEVQWEDYNPTTQWQNLANDLLWTDLAIG
jgi:hypothetical protein